MPQLPEAFAQISENEEPAITIYPFSFSDHDDAFRIGGAEIQAEHFDPYTFNPYAINLDEGLPYAEIPEHPAMIPIIGGLLVGPGLHDWARDNQDAVGTAIPVMKRVFRELYPSFDETDDFDMPEGGGHIGFDVRLQEDGGLVFQVLGNCACFGPDPHSYLTRDRFENGYAQYALHNNDYPFQRTAIYAGVGHLAFLAGGESARQMQLF